MSVASFSDKSKLIMKSKIKHQKKKKLYKFSPRYTAEWPCFIPCDFSEYHTYCKLCDMVISVAHKGRAGVNRHINSNRHLQNSIGVRTSTSTPSQPEVIRLAPAEVQRERHLIKSNMEMMPSPVSKIHPQVIRLTSADISSEEDEDISPGDVLQCIALEGDYPLNVDMNDNNCETPEADFAGNTTTNGVNEQSITEFHSYQSSIYQQNSKPATDLDDVNYMFGLSVIANLRQLPEKQASLARLKMQSILHEVSCSYQ